MLLFGVSVHTQRGCFHRDVKPSNCFLTAEGELRLGDFGLSRVWDTEASMTHEVVSRWYRAPELLLGQRHYGPEIDVWSSGCVFAELLRGYGGAFFCRRWRYLAVVTNIRCIRDTDAHIVAIGGCFPIGERCTLSRSVLFLSVNFSRMPLNVHWICCEDYFAWILRSV
ncbi:putative protein kinase [Trypanosoma cruzi]|uniref:[RNA-polymerase]-subunit kinase n=1 Tax=Trypanosoma cruzi TaxID=5693 RepID=A0A2V2VCI6_TRYCR|nr:putative protein kinase [Trypanosoma cruzi]